MEKIPASRKRPRADMEATVSPHELMVIAPFSVK